MMSLAGIGKKTLKLFRHIMLALGALLPATVYGQSIPDPHFVPIAMGDITIIIPVYGDQDGDGVNDDVDVFPFDINEWLDTDGDGTGNNADTDDDGDGLPDAYELSYSFDPLVADAALDADGDGNTNLQEYYNLTDPRDPLDFTIFSVTGSLAFSKVFPGIEPNVFSDKFGTAVAVEWNRMVVGADNDGINKGAARVFDRQTDGTWLETIKFSASGNAQLGDSVAVQGSEVFLGAPRDSGYNGRVIIYQEDTPGSWTSSFIGADETLSDYNEFGDALDVSGDRLIVGARGDQSAQGAAYIFEKDGNGVWQETLKLTASDGAGNDMFGSTVAIHGSVAVVSAQGESAPGLNSSGALYVYEEQSPGIWAETAKLTVSDASSYINLGAIDGLAINNQRILVGAMRGNGGASQSGDAYIFDKQPNGSWVETAAFHGEASGDWFGASVDFISRSKVLVGAPEANAGVGKAYLFEEQADGSWFKTEISNGLIDAENYKLGYAVSGDGLNIVIGNGGGSNSYTRRVDTYRMPYVNTTPAVIISAPADNTTFTESLTPVTINASAIDYEDGDLTGALSLVSSLDGPITSPVFLSEGVHTITASVTDSDSGVGSASIQITVSFLDSDGDGMADDWENLYGLNAFDGSDADSDLDYDGLSNLHEYQIGNDPSDPIDALVSTELRTLEADDWHTIGNNIARSGNNLAVKSNASDNDGGIPTRVNMFEKQLDGTWQQKQILDVEARSMDMSGDRLAVGDYSSDLGAQDGGAVHIYERQLDGQWLKTHDIFSPDLAADIRFGASVSLSGNNLLVLNDHPLRAYLFEYDEILDEWIGNELILPYQDSPDQASVFHASIYGNVAVVAEDNYDWSRGRVHIFERQLDGVWRLTQTLHAPDASQNAKFGYTVEQGQDKILVAAPWKNHSSYSYVGKVYLYERAVNGHWQLTHNFIPPTAQDSLYFGSTMDISGERIVIGQSSTEPQSYVYRKLEDGGWHETVLSHGIDSSSSGTVKTSIVAIQDDEVFRGIGSQRMGAKTWVGAVLIDEFLPLPSNPDVDSDHDGMTDQWEIANGYDIFDSTDVTDVLPVVNTAPVINILSPTHGATLVDIDGLLTITLEAYDVQDGDLTDSVELTSDVDGPLLFNRWYALSHGPHTLTATVTDSGGLTTVTSINVTMTHDSMPYLVFNSPAQYETIINGPSPSVYLDVSAQDISDGDISGNVVLSSNRDGVLQNQANNALSDGRHTILAEITDSGGFYQSKWVVVDVNPGDPNTVLSTLSFPDLIQQPLDTVVESTVVQVGGFSGTRNLSVSGEGSPAVSINGGAWSNGGWIESGDSLVFKVRTSDLESIIRSVDIDIVLGSSQTASRTWQVSTGADLPGGGGSPGGGGLQPPGSVLDPGCTVACTAVDPVMDVLPGSEYKGLTAGSFNVGNSGAASYSIPIEVPPGIKGLQPKFSLNYNSDNSSNGLLGWGWSIGGLSSITRCNASIARDGYISGVNSGDSFKFCLDGQRLVQIGGTEPGDLEFRTENEGFSKVIKSGDLWTLYRRDGSILEFGHTLDAKVTEQANGATFQWNLNRVTDIAGNYMDYVYSPSEHPGNYIIDRVEYTKNDNALADETNYVVDFIYDKVPGVSVIRGDIIDTYRGGVNFYYNKLLERVEISNNGRLVRNYQLNYSSFEDPSNTSYLTSVARCYDSQTNCADPVQFDWSDMSAASFAMESMDNPITAEEFTVLNAYSTGDYDGDGLPEVLYKDSNYPDTKTFIAEYGEAPTYTDEWLTGAYAATIVDSGRSVSPVDMNGDGFTDLLTYHSSSNAAYFSQLWLSQGNGFVEADPVAWGNDDLGEDYKSSPYPEYIKEQKTIMDLNGDKLPDVLLVVAKDFTTGPDDAWRIYVSLNQGGTHFATPERWFGGGVDSLKWSIRGADQTQFNPRKYQIGEFNGDGLPDLFLCTKADTGPCTPKVLINTGSGFEDISFDTSEISELPYKMGDLNGDGLTDLIMFDDVSMKVYLSTGSAFAPAEVWSDKIRLITSQELFNDPDDYGDPGNYIVRSQNAMYLVDAGTKYPVSLRSLSFAHINDDRCADMVYVSGPVYYKKVVEYTPPAAFQGLQVALSKCSAEGGGFADFSTWLSPKAGDVESFRTTWTGSLDQAAPVMYQAPLGRVDFNGDGLADVPYAGGIYGKNKSGKRQITKFSAAADRYYSVNYAPLTDPDVYAKDPLEALNDSGVGGVESTPLPTVDDNGDAVESVGFSPNSVPIPKYVVASQHVSDGIGGEIETTYHYEGYKRDKLGWGSLGFALVTTSKYLSGTSANETAAETLIGVNEFSQETGTHATVPYSGARLLLRSTLSLKAAGKDAAQAQRIKLLENHWQLKVVADDVDAILSPHVVKSLVESNQYEWDFDETAFLLEAEREVKHRSTYLLGDAAPSPQTCLDEGTVAELEITATDDRHDAYGNPGQAVEVICGVPGSSYFNITSTKQNYLNKIHQADEPWVLGLVTNQQITNTIIDTGSESLTRSKSFTYFTDGMLATETVEPDDPVHELITSYGYNENGLVESLLESWTTQTNDGLDFGNSRSTGITDSVDAQGVRTVTVTDAFSQVSSTVYHPDFGLPTKQTDIDGLSVDSAYNATGRLVSESFPYQAGETPVNANTYFYRTCPSAAECLPHNDNVRTYVYSKTKGSAGEFAYFDSAGRQLGGRSKGFGGETLYSYQSYDHLGRVVSSAAPFVSGDTPQLTGYDFDLLGRGRHIYHPDASTSETVYNGLELIKTNQLGQDQTLIHNAAGEVVESRDNLETPIYYAYHPFGNLARTQVGESADPKVSITTVTYNVRGEKTQLNDPDLGLRTYTYNALGLLSSETDAENQVTRYGYDSLGRQKGRIDDATGAALSHVWNYIGTGKGKGQLGSVIGYDTDGDVFSEVYTYNDHSLLAGTTTTIKGEGWTLSQEYDEFFRLQDETYPLSGLTVRHSYNANGYLKQIYNGGDGTTYWQANGRDARGNLTQYALGNGVITEQAFDPEYGRISSIKASKGAFVIQDHQYGFDSLGNLTSRADNHFNPGHVQNLCYDDLNRLLGPCGVPEIAYDDYGNIVGKLGVGELYSYNQTNNAGPHAVTSVTLNGQSRVFQYDLNGNLISEVGGEKDRIITYTTFNKPKLIQESGSKQTAINYGPDYNRITRVDGIGAEAVTTTYVGGKFEIVSDVSGSRYRHYIGGFAVYEMDDTQAQREHIISYLHKDHLGSIIAKSGQEAGNAEGVDWLSHDFWGKRRMQFWDGPDQPEDYKPTVTSRGYTGHEHLDEVGLIHMNGRVYDPVLGRFLSADPLVQAPFNSQSFNRYSYVLNNPLSLVDPSGYQWVSQQQCASVGYNTNGAQLITTYQCTTTNVWVEVPGSDTSSHTDSGVERGFFSKLGHTVLGVLGAVPVVGGVADAVDTAWYVAEGDLEGAALSGASTLLSATPGADQIAAGAKIAHVLGIGREVVKKSRLPKPRTGPGTVPRSERDPKRLFTPKEREAKRIEQGNKCANGCGTDIDGNNSAGHHITRHSDGGRTVPENHAEVCLVCHKKLHSGG